MRRVIIIAILMVAWTLVTVTPSIGADDGIVSATVSTPSPCMTLDKTAVDFGTLPFVTAYEVSGVQTVAVTNCAGGGLDEALHMTASDAESTTSATVWTLSDGPDTCSGIDVFRLGVANLGGGGAALSSTAFKDIGMVPAAAPATVDLELTMPCESSNGQGESFAFGIGFLVTIP